MGLNHTHRGWRVWNQWDYGINSKQNHTVRCACDGVAPHSWRIMGLEPVGLWLGWEIGLYNTGCVWWGCITRIGTNGWWNIGTMSWMTNAQCRYKQGKEYVRSREMMGCDGESRHNKDAVCSPIVSNICSLQVLGRRTLVRINQHKLAGRSSEPSWQSRAAMEGDRLRIDTWCGNTGMSRILHRCDRVTILNMFRLGGMIWLDWCECGEGWF